MLDVSLGSMQLLSKGSSEVPFDAFFPAFRAGKDDMVQIAAQLRLHNSRGLIPGF